MADFGTIGQLSYVPPYIHWWWGYKFVPFSDQYKVSPFVHYVKRNCSLICES